MYCTTFLCYSLMRLCFHLMLQTADDTMQFDIMPLQTVLPNLSHQQSNSLSLALSLSIFRQICRQVCTWQVSTNARATRRSLFTAFAFLQVQLLLQSNFHSTNFHRIKFSIEHFCPPVMASQMITDYFPQFHAVIFQSGLLISLKSSCITYSLPQPLRVDLGESCEQNASLCHLLAYHHCYPHQTHAIYAFQNGAFKSIPAEETKQAHQWKSDRQVWLCLINFPIIKILQCSKDMVHSHRRLTHVGISIARAACGLICILMCAFVCFYHR